VIAAYTGRLPLRLLSAPGSNISQGRNLAIGAAAGPIIAVTDAGVRLADCWLEEIIRPLEESGASVVSGWFAPDPHNDFELAMGATVLPALSDVEPESFEPSSRSVAFRKECWQAVGGYPEWLDYCEDLVFDRTLRRHFGPFAFVPRAVAFFRPRGSLSALYRQYYLYARGDGKADLFRCRHAIRYATYLLILPILTGLIGRGRLVGWLLLALGLAAHTGRPLRRLWQFTPGWPRPRRWRLLALVPLIRLVGDMAKMAGYPAGLLWRLRRR
jgi:hypothetical protein